MFLCKLTTIRSKLYLSEGYLYSGCFIGAVRHRRTAKLRENGCISDVGMAPAKELDHRVDRWWNGLMMKWTSISTSLKLTTVPGLPPSYGCQVHQGRRPAAWSGSQLSAAWRQKRWMASPKCLYKQREGEKTCFFWYGDTVSYDISVTF